MSKREGRAAKKPKEEGESEPNLARYSLQVRARMRALTRSGSISTPGAVMEAMDVLVPTDLERRWSASNVQDGTYQPLGSPPAWFRAG